MCDTWPSEERTRDILSFRFRGLGPISRLNLCPKPSHLNSYDIVEINNHEKQFRMVPFDKEKAVILTWRSDLCMWLVRLLKGADILENIIEQERQRTSTSGTYLCLPTESLRLLQRHEDVRRYWSKKRAPNIKMQPASKRPGEMRVFPFTVSGSLWQLEYSDDKVVFPFITLRSMQTEKLHVWRRGHDVIEERVAVELDVDDHMSELGEEIGERPQSGTASEQQLLRRAKKFQLAPPELAAYARAVPGEKNTYTILADQFEDAQTNVVMLGEISLTDMDLMLHDGMFVRKSAFERISQYTEQADAFARQGRMHEAVQKISGAIGIYGDLDDVPPDLYDTRSTYWRYLASNEVNRDTRKRYERYAVQDTQRMRAQRGV